MHDLRSSSGLLALMGVPGVSASGAVALARAFPSLDMLAAASPEEVSCALGGRRSPSPGSFASLRVEGPVDGTVCIFDPGFPRALAGIPSPPPVLWFEGTLPPVSAIAVAVVGTRSPTVWGARATEAAVEALAPSGAVVVSGLAYGVDGLAHRRALSLGLRTCAVLGSGVDVLYPRAHARLAREMVEAGGALLSEVPPGTAPSARSLVARNRIQTGLSRLVVASQFGVPSGTLHTVRFALLQGRPVVVPSPTGRYVSEPASEGNRALAGGDLGVLGLTPDERDRLSGRPLLAAAPEDGESLRRALSGLLRDGAPAV